VPAVLADVLAARARGRLPRLRLAVVAGAALPVALRARAAELGIRVVEYYGAAELSFVATDSDGTGLRAFPDVRVRVRDGLVEVRSPYVALGYAGGAGPLTVVDGWAGVGDRGRLGPDGVLVVAGRGDDALDVGGTTVLLADVERALGRVPGVVDVACVADPDPARSGRPAVVVRPGSSGVDRAQLVRELRAAARRELPPPARPVRYAVVDALPRTPAGKPDREELRRVLTPPTSL
jgi:long-chain acyl-CoA synthetase